MRNLIMALSAASLIVPTVAVIPAAAQDRYDRQDQYDRQTYNRNHRYTPREYTGRDGKRYCRHSDGTTGLIVGGVGGALLGNTIAGHGDKTLGTVLGGVAGAFGGRAVDRASTADRRCN